jgi:hypothetical protein
VGSGCLPSQAEPPRDDLPALRKMPPAAAARMSAEKSTVGDTSMVAMPGLVGAVGGGVNWREGREAELELAWSLPASTRLRPRWSLAPPLRGRRPRGPPAARGGWLALVVSFLVDTDFVDTSRSPDNSFNFDATNTNMPPELLVLLDLGDREQGHGRSGSARSHVCPIPIAPIRRISSSRQIRNCRVSAEAGSSSASG